MATMDDGKGIVRPLSKGTDHLTGTWKVADDILQHVDVGEEGQGNACSISKSLLIGDKQFEDLDEIVAQYTNPMAARVRDLLSFRYIRDLGLTEQT
jgi:transcription elongation factor SPT6